MISRTLLSSKKFGTLKIKLYLLKIELLIVVSIWFMDYYKASTDPGDILAANCSLKSSVRG